MSKMNSIFAKRSGVNKINSDLQTQKINRSGSKASSVDRILYLQRTIGNQAVSRLIRSKAVQAKLRIGQPGDVYEQEADRVADEVMRMPEPEMQRQVEEEEEEEEMLQAKSREDSTSEVSYGLESQINAIKGGGRPLAESERAYFEPRFGTDFSLVRVHTGAQAAESARSVNAKAYTIGQDVTFGVGQYTPGTSEGRRLIAHELTHVVQQGEKSVFTHKKSLNVKDENHTLDKTISKDTISEDLMIARDELPGPMSLPEQPPMTMASWAPSERGRIAVSIALGEVGVREDPSGSNRGSCSDPGATRGCVDAYTGGRAHPWCAHFVSWAFEQTGFSPFGHRASVNSIRSWGRSMGWYIPTSQVSYDGFQPMAGDIFTKPRYEGRGPQRRLVGGHTGFVVDYDFISQVADTVEGNTGDEVKLRTRTLTELDGFIRIGT
jgi:hypothetical protein